MLGGANQRTLFVVANEWRGMENIAAVAGEKTRRVFAVDLEEVMGTVNRDRSIVSVAQCFVILGKLNWGQPTARETKGSTGDRSIVGQGGN